MKEKLKFPGPDPMTDDMPEEFREAMLAVDRVVERAAEATARFVDDEITKAVSMRIGPDWVPRDLIGRLHRTVFFNGSELMSLDGAPILYIGPWMFPMMGEPTRECTHMKDVNDTTMH